MNTQATLPVSRIQKVMHSTLAKLILGFLMIFIPSAIGELFILSLPLTSLWRSILAAGFAVPVALGAYYILVHFIERREMTELSLPGAAQETTQGILVGALLFCSIMAILSLTGAYKVLGTNRLIVLLPSLVFAVKATVVEEILFRGVLFRLVERSLGSWLALAISSAIFGGLHMTNANATLTGAIAIMLTGGFVLGAAFMLTRRLWLPMGIHFAVNFLQSGVFGSAVSGNQAGQALLRSSLTGPNWLIGGAFGVEASMVTAIIGLVVGSILVWLAHRRGNVLRPYWSRSENWKAKEVIP